MTPTIREIQERAAEICKVRLDDMLSERRQNDVTRARHIAMYAARVMTPAALTVIGRAFRRDHTTVMYGINRIDQDVWTDADLYATVKAVCGDWQRGAV